MNLDETRAAFACCTQTPPDCASCPQQGPGFGFACRQEVKTWVKYWLNRATDADTGKWISVEERLPEDGLLGKLIYDKENGVRICRKLMTTTLANGKKIYNDDPELIDFLRKLAAEEGDTEPPEYVTHITHWMETPEGPGGEKQCD